MNATERRITAAALRLFAERGSLEVSVSELAAEAGVARGTLYRHVQSVEQLFGQVVESLSAEMHAKIAAGLDQVAGPDPARRLAAGLRMFVRLAHENPAMGRFIVRFGLTDESLRSILSGPPMHDVDAGIAMGRYPVPESMRLSIASLMIGATVSAMWMVVEGHQAWREAGSAAAHLLLRALGIDEAEAAEIASSELPPLAES